MTSPKVTKIRCLVAHLLRPEYEFSDFTSDRNSNSISNRISNGWCSHSPTQSLQNYQPRRLLRRLRLQLRRTIQFNLRPRISNRLSDSTQSATSPYVVRSGPMATMALSADDVFGMLNLFGKKSTRLCRSQGSGMGNVDGVVSKSWAQRFDTCIQCEPWLW